MNYDMPNIAENYVHRIGRTGRAGSTGEAISLVMDDEVKLLRAIERLIKHTIPVNQIEGFSKPAKVTGKDEAAGAEAHRSRRRGGSKGTFRGGRPHETKGNSGGARRRKVPKR